MLDVTEQALPHGHVGQRRGRRENGKRSCPAAWSGSHSATPCTATQVGKNPDACSTSLLGCIILRRLILVTRHKAIARSQELAVSGLGIAFRNETERDL